MCQDAERAPYLQWHKMMNYTGEQRDHREDVLWMPRVANLVEDVNHGVLAMKLECYVKIEIGACWQVTEDFPGWRVRLPCVLHPHVIPTR